MEVKYQTSQVCFTPFYLTSCLLMTFVGEDDLKSRFIACIQDGARDLDISGFELPHCPPQVEENTRLASLVRLNLGFNKLRLFPDLRRLTKLCILHLAGNAIASVDGVSFASLTKLRELTLTGNLLSDLPTDIGAFTKLERLDVSNNRLTALPNEIGYCVSLVELRASGNPIGAVPRTVRSLVALELANFDFCQIASLCSEITLCSRLLELGLAKNRLRDLPRDFGRLTRLTTLNISDNLLSDLPISMGRCQALGELGAGVQLEGNPIQNASILKARAIGPDHLMFFLEKRMEAMPGGVQPLPDIPWHNLIEQRDGGRSGRAANNGASAAATTIALPGVGLASSTGASTSGRVAAEQRERHNETQRKVEALKRWAHEQINEVYIPKLRKIKRAVEEITTLEQGQALAGFMQRLQPSIEAVAELLPDVEPAEPPRLDASLPPIQVMRASLNFGCQQAKQTLEQCEQFLEASSHLDTIVAFVKALKEIPMAR
jgi:hypothetical protein